MDPAAAHARRAVAGARRPAGDLRLHLHPDRLLSPPGGAAVHILRDPHRRAVPQLLELSLSWWRMECDLLGLPEELRFGGRLSLHCRRRKDAVAARRLFTEP